MLGLTLREEFRGKRLQGTQIELPAAVQRDPREFLDLTYPTRDVLVALEALGPGHGRPVVLIGDRGQGKSHLLAAMVHALRAPDAARSWLKGWSERLSAPKLAELPLRTGMHVISENLHRQNYKFLWDLLFSQHPHGAYIRGKWEGQGDARTDIPGEKFLSELFALTPTVLVLDEYQTWFDGLTNTKQYPWRNWAFNFIQLLSEIAEAHPERLVLVVSVRNGTSDAYQQIQRNNPVLVDFKGPNARRDRLQLLLHRLFENRAQVSPAAVQQLIGVHVSEALRLLEVPPSEHTRIRQDYEEAWPYSPSLMELLEDQILVATNAQETRDLIKILADLFKGSGDLVPVLTAADFRLDDDRSGIASLLDSVSNQHHEKLRQHALTNLAKVREGVQPYEHASRIPHAAEIVGALWVRSLAVGNRVGATPAMLQVDITRGKAIDDNAFQDELTTIRESSYNLHTEGDRIVFKEPVNPEAKLRSHAKNPKLFAKGEDKQQLAGEIRAVLGESSEAVNRFQIIVLPPLWTSDPWGPLDESMRPDRWDERRVQLLVVPEHTDKMHARLGRFLADHVPRRRNAVRFLLPPEGSGSAYVDNDLIVNARAVWLAEAWRVGSPEYRPLKVRFENELRAILKRRFDRFAILDTWSFQKPESSTFHVFAHKALGAAIPEAVDKMVREDLFIPEEFEAAVLAAAEATDSVGKLLRELQEPRPNGEPCIAWLGDTATKEAIERLCARGRLAINLRGSQHLQVMEGEDEASAWAHMRGKLGTGKHLDETTLHPPQPLPKAGGVSLNPDDAGVTGTVPQVVEINPINHGWGDADDAPSTPSPQVQPPTINIFKPISKPRVQRETPATSPLNLLGQLDRWGIQQATPVEGLTVEVDKLTGAQLKRLLEKLPDGMIYKLKLSQEES